MMFCILKILLMISPFVSFQQKPFRHAKSFPWLITLCWSTNDHCFIVLCATFFKLFFIFWHIVALCFLFRGLNIMRVINHSSLQLTFSSNRPIGLQGFTATRISPIYVWKNSKTTSVSSSYCSHKDTGGVTDFPRPP